MDQEGKQEFVQQKLEQQLSRFGLELDDLPESKREQLESHMVSIVENEDGLKKGAAQEVKKALR